MNNAWKVSSIVLLTLIIASSLTMVKPSFAQTSMPKPSVPEFTIKLVAHPYDVAPVTTTDPYTGKTITQHYGYHVENKSVKITIKNSPLPKLSDDNNARLYYNVSYKGHFEADWNFFSYDSNTRWFIAQSDSDFTIISFSDLPDVGQMDFRVQAQIGNYTERFYLFMDTEDYSFNGEVSGWSNIQTVSIPSGSSSVELAIFIVFGVAIALLVVIVALLSRKIMVLERKQK
jgi:hypothetical protein